MADMFSQLKSLQPGDVFEAPNDLPYLEVSSSTDYMIFRAMDSVRNSLLYVKGRDDPTPYHMTAFLVNVVPDKDWRIKTFKTLAEIKEDYKIIDIGQPEMHALCTDLVGTVTDWQTRYRRSILNLGVGGV